MVDARKSLTGEIQTKPIKGLTAAVVLPLVKMAPHYFFSVNTFLMRKQKGYVYHIYFEIATFLKTGDIYV